MLSGSGSFSRLLTGFLPVILALLAIAPSRAAEPRLEWDPILGVKLHADTVHIVLDRDERQPSLLLRFWPNGAGQTLGRPETTQLGPHRLRLVYRAEAPVNNPFQLTREISARAEGPGVTVLSEQLTLSATQPIRCADVELERPFMVESDAPITSSSELSLILPHASGWAEVTTVGQEAWMGVYPFGSTYPPAEAKPAAGDSSATQAGGREALGALPPQVPTLALPLVQLGGAGWRCAVMADPAGNTFFTARQGGSGISGSLHCRFPARQVPLTSATRSFAFHLQTGSAPRRPFDGALEAFTRLMGTGAPPPPWLRRVAMVQVADIGDGGAALERDLRRLAEWLTPAERGQVAIVVGGWYNAIFPYSFDHARGGFEKAWLASGGHSRWLSPEALRRLLRQARGLGYRVLLVFSEGLAADSGTPYFPADWAWREDGGALRRLSGDRPRAYGPLGMLNPADPRVGEWFLAYTDALLEAFGKDVDGFVMRDTGQVPQGTRVNAPRPMWADRALLTLARSIHDRVRATSPTLAFLTGDRPGGTPTALVADGTLGRQGCDPDAAVHGLFPCAGGVLWDSARDGLASFPESAWCARKLGMPIAVTSGPRGEGGPASWTVYQRDRIMKQFHELRHRLIRAERTVYLSHDPEASLKGGPQRMTAGDPVPLPQADEVNWAADRWTSVTASSEQPEATATSAVRGRRGAGWANQPGRDLPQWLQVDFGRPRRLTRCVVTTTQDERSTTATAGRLGIVKYEIQAWDEAVETWRTVVDEDAEWAVKTRVHALEPPLATHKLRLYINEVAPLDGVARVAAFEAWGPGRKDTVSIITQDAPTSATTLTPVTPTTATQPVN